MLLPELTSAKTSENSKLWIGRVRAKLFSRSKSNYLKQIKTKKQTLKKTNPKTLLQFVKKPP